MANLFGDDETRTVAGWITLGLVTLAGWWKARLIIRRDRREDIEDATVDDGYGRIIKQLRVELDRVSDTVNNLSSRLTQEITLRVEAEARAYSAEIRAISAEQRAKDLETRVRILEQQQGAAS